MYCANQTAMKKLTLLIIGFTLILLTTGITTVPSNHLYEESIEVENWMTKPFIDTVEEELNVEDWMTKPFNTK